VSITDRPFAGTWRQFDGVSRPVSRMVPDCLVYVNGFTTLPGCPSCNGKIDLQKYITQVSVDPNTEPIANATISMSIPAIAGEYFFRDGDFLLRPGLEIVIYMRGRFATTELLSAEDSIPLTEGEEGGDTFDPTGIPINPYYQVFHGVVTEASHEYSGGEYTASMSCSDVLHFWQNLKISTNGAVFGPRPDNSGVAPVLQGHSFQGASPYSIIYTLYRVGFGAAGAVEYNLAQDTNVDATSEVSGQTHYKAAALWWEKKWASNSLRLKMYGTDGTLYNAWTQAYLGIFSGKNPDQLKALLGKGGNDYAPFNATSDKVIGKVARDLGYNPLSTQVSLATSTGGNTSSQDALKQQAFCLDIGVLGNVNLFETEYLSKLEIANAVRTITGFEFYQDVTGDLVFKPPMYNMDTSTDPVYVVEDSDLISISQSEREPEATYIKGTGSHFQNTKGVGLDGWLGMNSTYVDYRLVAQFGWRESEFESSYISDTRALFVLAMNRLDLVNIGCKSASITIPLRPELRPGYPIYVRYLDCFYYIQSMNHSFQFGGQCTTTINGVGKRAKFNAPGIVPGNRAPNIGDIRLDNPYLPSLPLSLRLSEVEGQSLADTSSDPPRIQGFPNVVLALDPTKVSAGSMVFIENLPLDQILIYALSCGVMQISPDAEGATESERRLNGPWTIGSANNEGITITRSELQTQWASLQQALTASTDKNAPKKTLDTLVKEGLSSTLAQLLVNVKARQGLNSNDQSTLNYLALMNDTKAAFGISSNVVGTYRYFSCSHPSPEHQGTTNLVLGGTAAGDVPTAATPAPLDAPYEVAGFTFQPPSPTASVPAATERSAERATGGDMSSLKPVSRDDTEAYYTKVLTGIGVPNTANNRAFLAAWAAQEGGTGGSKALYNPLNTTWRKAGATAFNYNKGNPVKNYATYDDGVSATVSTLRQGYYKPIVDAMMAGTNTPSQIAASQGVSKALDTWGSKGARVAAVAASGVTTLPSVWGGDAQAVGRNVGQTPIYETEDGTDIISADFADIAEVEFAGTVKYGTLRPMAGLKVLQFDVPKAGEYTTDTALAVSTPEMTVPTSEIHFVTFAGHSLTIDSLVVRAADGSDLGANLSQPSQASITDMLNSYLLRATSGMSDKTVRERYDEINVEVLAAIAENLYENSTRTRPRAALQAATITSGTSAGKTYYEQVSAALEYYGHLPNVTQKVKAADNATLDLNKTVKANFTGKKNAPEATSESRGTRLLCSSLAQGAALFYNLVLTAMQQAAKQLSGTVGYDAEAMTAIYNEMYEGRNAFLQNYASLLGLPYTPPVNPTGEVKITIAKQANQRTFTPVFPVSDARGYEVVGAQRYGRGLTAATFDQIMRSSRETTVDGLKLSSRALLGDISTDTTTLTAIESFYLALAKNSGNLSLAFKELDSTQQGALLTAAADSVEGGVTLDDPTVFTNLIAKAQSYGQSTQYSANVPARLADIEIPTTNPSPCSCKVTDAQTYLLASTGEYVQLQTHADVNEFLLSEARLKAKAWQQSRDAMSGQALDPSYSSLAEQFTNTLLGGDK